MLEKFAKWWRKIFMSKKQPTPPYFEGCGWYLPATEGYPRKGGINEGPSVSRPPPPTVLSSAYRSPTFLRMCGYTPQAIDDIIKNKNNPPSP